MMLGYSDLHWEGHQLFRNGSRRVVLTIVPDVRWPRMWRIKLTGGLTDMLNLPRAKDAGKAIALARLNAEMRPGMCPAEAPPIAANDNPATPIADAA